MFLFIHFFYTDMWVFYAGILVIGLYYRKAIYCVIAALSTAHVVSFKHGKMVCKTRKPRSRAIVLHSGFISFTPLHYQLAARLSAAFPTIPVWLINRPLHHSFQSIHTPPSDKLLDNLRGCRELALIGFSLGGIQQATLCSRLNPPQVVSRILVGSPHAETFRFRGYEQKLGQSMPRIQKLMDELLQFLPLARDHVSQDWGCPDDTRCPPCPGHTRLFHMPWYVPSFLVHSFMAWDEHVQLALIEELRRAFHK